MQGVVMLKHTGPMTEISYFRDREPVGMKRRGRRGREEARRAQSSAQLESQCTSVCVLRSVIISSVQGSTRKGGPLLLFKGHVVPILLRSSS